MVRDPLLIHAYHLCPQEKPFHRLDAIYDDELARRLDSNALRVPKDAALSLVLTSETTVRARCRDPHAAPY